MAVGVVEPNVPNVKGFGEVFNAARLSTPDAVRTNSAEFTWPGLPI